MAGHNKWSKVKHIKGAADAKRGKLFSKLSREITVAAKEGGGDPDLNPRLRNAITAAKAQNMPNDTIDRAVKKGTGEIAGVTYDEALYEGFAPGGVGVLVEVVTDNKNRSAAEIRSVFNKNNGSLGSSGSVAYLFDRRGEIRVPSDSISEDELIEAAVEAGADDVAGDGSELVVTTAQDQLYAVATQLRNASIDVRSQALVYSPQTRIAVPDAGTANQVLRIYELLDELDDTQEVFTNADIPDAILEEVSSSSEA